MALVQISRKSDACITIDELRSHLRIETTAEDALLAQYARVAEEMAEGLMHRAVSTQTWELVLDSFPDGGIELPRPPVSSSAADVSITYYDSSGALSTLASTAYTVDSDTEPGWVVPSDDNEWPDTYDMINAVRIRYGCGYASTAVPMKIKQWILMRAGFLYENRESLAVGPGGYVNTFPRDFIDGLLDEYVIREVY